MWIRTPQGIYYPKYPAGLPLIYATLIRLSAAYGKTWCFLVSPVCATLALAAMFLLVRMLAGSFHALLGMIVLATGQTTLLLTNDPNSHAAALCFSLWGMCLLAFWCRSGKTWVGVLAGLVLGYAVTIRYTEGLLLLPLLAAVLLDYLLRLGRGSWRRLGTWLRPAAPLLAWLVPTLSLVIFNNLTMGHWTGYDFTKESEGFTQAEFYRKWEFTTQELYLYGLIFIAPLGIAGMVLIFRRAWTWGVLMALWFVPGAVLYTSYYWGLQSPGVGFLRFFLTLFPPVIACAMWLLRSAGEGAGVGVGTGAGAGAEAGANESASPAMGGGSVAHPIAAGVVVAIAGSIGLYASLPELERQHAGNLNLAYSATQIVTHVSTRNGGKPVKPVVFADEGLFPQLLMYMQFIGDYDWYAADAFDFRLGGGFFFFANRRSADQDSPVLVQPERRDYMEGVLHGKSESDLTREQNRIMNQAFDQGRPVYAVIQRTEVWDFESRFLGQRYQAEVISRWREPAPVPAERDPTPLTTTAHVPNLILNWEPRSWVLMRISRKSLAAPPAPIPVVPGGHAGPLPPRTYNQSF